MRQPSAQERKDYKYIVNFVIDVKRTDNHLLDSDENAMVDEMRTVVEGAISTVMEKHGSNNHKSLGNTKVVY